MSESTVAIIGTGVAGAAIADALTKRGIDVALFEKGPSTPYPPVQQHIENVRFLRRRDSFQLSPDLDHVTSSGDYHTRLAEERDLRLGGCCMRWAGITLRMLPQDFRLRSTYGYGDDWPIAYADLEPYYCEAEAFLGVSGTDADNPFAPPRSKPHPLPAFELSHDDTILAERLKHNGIVLHTTPQARTRKTYDERPACDNYGACVHCPIGARYFPVHHLNRVTARNGRIEANTSVRRITVENNAARTLVYRRNNGTADCEHAAKVIVVAAGTFESPRLLLLSKQPSAPDGIGNAGGQVGRNLTFHHFWAGYLHYDEPHFTAGFGGWTGQSCQFLDPPDRGKHGGVKIEFSSNTDWPTVVAQERWSSGKDVREALRSRLKIRPIGMHGESMCTDAKFVRLSEECDRFGDAFAHVHYESSGFDAATYKFAKTLFQRFRDGSGAKGGFLGRPNAFSTAWHHMGTCRMGISPDNSVVDQHCRVHGLKNLYVVGQCSMAGSGGAVNPTLTVTALALRAADHIAEQLKG